MLPFVPLLLIAGAPPAGFHNLLPNPGFEQIADERPTGWSSHDFRTGGLAQVEPGGAEGSARCVALESRDSTERIAWLARADLPPETRYVAAGGVYRTEGVASAEGRGACFRVHFHGPRDGKMQELELKQAFFPPREQWTRTEERYFIVPAGTERIELQVFNWLTPGITRWDDVWVRTVGEQEFKALPDHLKPAVPLPPAVTFEAEAARLAPDRAEVVAQESFPSQQGVSLKAGLASRVGEPDATPDLVFPVTAAAPGRYLLQTHAATDAVGAETMRRASGKHQSLQLQLAIDGGRPTQRVVFVPWSRPESCTQTLGKFSFSGEPQEIAVWLPAGVRLDHLRLAPYVPPPVPAAVNDYQPPIVPPASRPRLWVNQDSLPQVRTNLEKGENAAVWARLRERAARPFDLKIEPGTEVGYDSALESAAVAKAFVFLMTGDEAFGREAVRLISAYLPAVEFGNLLDITREIGRAIYSAALVYDWCYDLLDEPARELLRENLMRLADDMEIGWPPFRQMIANGHGNEAQVNRDLLAMSIAIWDEDPVPYQYCAYRILEELVPMRRFEYQSPRHNQGVSYGPYRYGWDLHAATLFQRMSGGKVFDDNLGGVYQHWLYLRVPDHRMLRDGDGFSDARPASFGLTSLLNYAYTGNPIVKHDFLRAGGMDGEAMMILLLNDPDLAPSDGFNELPLTKDFGPILGSMVARTGWNMGRNTADVVVEMKGGGYNFGNHQHADAGAFQIYWRGLQVTDLGQYRYYGTPYDSNFCKRSISHSGLLVVDPEEKFAGATTNDGGTRSVRACPTTPEQATGDPLFAYGEVRSASFGPDPMRPFFSHFAVDLDSAYSDKIDSFVRSFCFLNLGDEQTPAALIVLDTVTASDPSFRKYWQVNTLNPPEPTADGVILRNSDLGRAGRVDLRMLRPSPAERSLEVLRGAAANSVFGTPFEAPFPDRPEANGHRVMFSPTTARANDTFLTVMTMADEDAPALPVAVAETDAVYIVTLADRAVVLPRGGALLATGCSFELPAGADRQLLIAGLAPGTWGLSGGDVSLNLEVAAGQHTGFAVVPGGRYTLAPVPIAGAASVAFGPEFVPTASASLNQRIFVAGRLLPDARVRTVAGRRLVPVQSVGEALGLTVTETAEQLTLRAGERTAVFAVGADRFRLNDRSFALSAPALRDDGVWRLPADLLATLAGAALTADEAGGSVELQPDARRWPAELLWVEANREGGPATLATMVTDLPGSSDYWAAEGDGVQVELTLVQPTRLAGVGIQWHQGDRRQARFALEASLDGERWERVFEGASSGGSADLETYEFAPREARWVRLIGSGNSANRWNSIVHLRVIPASG